MDNTETRPPLPIVQIVIGLVLLIVGVVSFGYGIDLWNPRRLVRLWPLGLIIMGAASEFEALRNRRNDGGSFFLAAGVWLLFGTLHLFDMTMRSAFPLGIIVLGLATVVHAIVDRPEKKKENHNASA